MRNNPISGDAMLRETTSVRGSVAIIVAALLCAATPAALAENMVKMGYGEGSPGDTDVEVMITATNDTEILGYSVAFTFPPEVLVLKSISTSGTQVQAVSPDFVAPRTDNQIGVGSLGVIFAFTEPITLKELAPLSQGSYPRIVARLVFDVKPDAQGGSYALKLVDGIGQPASFNRFSSRGTSIVPKLEGGTFRVAGGNTITLEKKIAFPGIQSSQAILALVQHPEPLAGFQIGFTYDKNAMELTSATYAGTSMGIALRPDEIEAYKFDVDTFFSDTLGRATVGALFDFLPPFRGQVLPPSMDSPPNQSVMKFNLKVKAEAADRSQYYDLVLSNTSIPGAIDNRFIIQDRSIDPMLIPGKIYFSEGSLRGRILDSVSLQGVPGVKVVTDPDGFSTTTDVNGRFLTPNIPPGRYELILSRSGYYGSRHMKGSGGVGDIIVNGSGTTDDIGDVPLYKIPTGGPSLKFLRGYVNPDGKVDLSDAIFLLNYLFGGGDEPRCRLAADINDDEKVDISDTIFMLNYLFVGGAVPPPPFSQLGIGCATDPTPDARLDCREFTCPS